MAFTSAITDQTVIGNLRMHYGTYSCAAVTTGELVTGLSTVNTLMLQSKGTAVTTGASVVNETFPLTGSAVTLITDSGDVGYWIAIGL